jgi:protein-S-isoprenylcysteine O-methyltransferase Ste14
VPPGQGDNAGVIAPPPLIYVVPLGIGLYLDRANPFPIMPARFAEPAGVALLALALILAVWAFAQFWRKHTSVMPYKPTTTIIQSGPFRFTRNPLYLSLTLLYLGVALVMNAAWPLLLLPLVLLVVHRGVIQREERYLEQKFGDEYISYKSRVRRWI